MLDSLSVTLWLRQIWEQDRTYQRELKAFREGSDSSDRYGTRLQLDWGKRQSGGMQGLDGICSKWERAIDLQEDGPALSPGAMSHD